MVILNELLLSHLLRSLTARRIGNITKTSIAFLLSTLLQKRFVWGIPPVLTIEPTNLCNLQCPLCTTGAGEMRRSAGKMTLETFKRIIDLMADDIFFLLIYHQGEPYINKNFFKFIEMAKTKNIYVTTSTNGHFFNRDNIEKTLDSGLDSMIVSVDGSTQQIYEKYRIGGRLNRVIEGTRELINLRNLRKQRAPNIALQFLVMKQNEHDIPQIKKLASQLQVDRLLIKNIEVRSTEEAKQWLPQKNKFRRYHFDGQQLVVKNVNNRNCSRPWLSTLINWDGLVVPCCFDKNGDHPLGNIHDVENMTEIWQGNRYNSFRQKLIRNRVEIDICRNCNQGFGSFLPEKFWNHKKKS